MSATPIRILDKIDTGGMAEILKAEDTQTHDILAIKRILPQFEQNPRFVQMFIDEAKISLALNHPNIVHVYQLAKMDSSYTIVMEFVQGINLRELLQFCNEYQYRLPLAESLHIAMEILKGLEYAHQKCGDDGELLNIVHRDLSPPNILLSTKGEVKITDFGLAKAKSQITQTVPGLIKGKFSYLAPETAYGESLDKRADLYAVGIILWEMLSARPLFYDDIEANILDLVRKSQIPALQPYNPHVSPALEHIVQKSLQRQREGRYQSASEFYLALHNYCKTNNLVSTELPNIVQSLQATEEQARKLHKPQSAQTPRPPKTLTSNEPETLSTLIPIDVIMNELRQESHTAAQPAPQAPPARASDKTDRILRIVALVLCILIIIALFLSFFGK